MGKDRELPAVDPAAYSESKPVTVGLGIWVVLLVLALVFRDDLQADGHGWWIWTAVAGIVQGLAGSLYISRRAARMNHRTTANAPDVSERDSRTPGRS